MKGDILMEGSKLDTFKILKVFFENINLSRVLAKIIVVFIVFNSIYIPYGIYKKAEAVADPSDCLYYYDVYNADSYVETITRYVDDNWFGQDDDDKPWRFCGYYGYELSNGRASTRRYSRICISSTKIGNSHPMYKVYEDGKEVHEYYANTYRSGCKSFIVRYRVYEVDTVTRYKRGSYKYRITGTASRYPSNGKSGSYWYVRRGIADVIPTLTINTPTENEYFSNKTSHDTISIKGSTNDPDSGDSIAVKYTLHNVDNNTDLAGHKDKKIFNVVSDGTSKPFNSNITVDNTIPEGKYILSMWAVDNMGSKSSVVSRNITIDKTPPKINERNFNSTINNITVNCTALDEKALAEKPYRYTIEGNSTNWADNSTYNFTDLIPNKKYEIKTEVSDKAGNISSTIDNVYTKAEVPSITVNNPTSITLDLTMKDNNFSNTAYQIVNTSNDKYVSSSGQETTSPTWLIPQNKKITITGLTPLTTYTYKVRAKNEEGIETEFSSPAGCTTLAPPPEKVSEVTATATSNEITIHWNPVDNATSYEVEADGGEPIDNGTNLSYTHIQLLPNSEHNYRVRAKNGEVEGEWSEAITKSTLPLAPVIPTNINTLSTENTITLTWNAVGNAVSYDIELDGEVISNGNSTNYVHTGLLPNTTHSYRIRSINPAGKSEWSSEVTAKTITDSLPIPMNIVANSGKTSVEIRWNEIVGMEYQIEADGNIIDNGINCIYTHSGLTPDTEHTYRVRSHKAGSYSDWSSPIKVRTSKDIFTAPSNIRSSATDTSIMISWEGVTGADGYDVEADGVIVDNGLNTSFTHKGLMPNTSHIYRIRARQGDTTSDWSSAINIVNISTYALATPKNLRATATETKIVASWDMVTNADSYDIKINNDPIENITDTTYTISGLVPGTQKKIMVRAVNAKGTSAYTVPITVITKASSSDSPQNISALTAKNQITLMWEPIQGAVSYDIEGNGAVTSVVSANSYTFAELQPNTTYTYKIRVNKADGMQGQWSKAVTVITMADAPDAPQNLTASSTLNSVRLSWDGAVGAVEYEVEAGGQILNAGASNNYLITGLTPNTEYTYKVRAKNPTTVGNWSQPITIKTKSSIQNYNINGNIGEEKNLVLNAIDIRDFEKYTFTITYNPDEIEIVDIASQTARPDISIGNIGGTDIEVIQNTPGTLQFKKKSTLPIGQSYSGIINSIRLKFKVDKEAVITYTIQ
jgi:chitodextrinase